MPFKFNPFTARLDYFESVASGGGIVSITGDSGGAEVPDGSGNFNLKGTTNQIVVTGSANTETFSLSSTLVTPGSLTSTGIFTTSSGQVVKRTVPGAYPYTVLSTDYIVEVDTSAARTINLPNAPTTGTVYIIKDITGSATTNNATITTVGGSVTIDGLTSKSLFVNYQSITVYFNGTSYFII